MASSSVVRIELLNKENFDTWKIQMEAILIKNDAWDFVTGENIKPEIHVGDAESVEAARRWENHDRKAKSDIVLAIKPSEIKQIKGCNTSKEVWEKLKSIYQSSGPARKATLLKQLTQHKMSDSDDAREHTRKFFDTVDKLSEMEVEINRDLLSVMLLYSLPSTFENFRCAIETRDELPDLEALRIKIIEECDARKNESRDGGTNAMFAKRQWNKPKNNLVKKDSESRMTNKTKREPFKYKCHRCHEIGHKAVDCTAFKRVANSAIATDEASLYTGAEEHMQATGSAEARVAQSNEKHWCLDSGCTTHMGNDEAKFSNLMKSCNGSVRLASGSASTPIEGKGSVRIATNVDGRAKNVKVNDVLRVPELRTNLLSVGKIADKDNIIVFDKNKAEVFDKSGSTVLIADRKNGLYYVRAENDEYSAKVEITDGRIQEKSTNEWHRKMGHLNMRDLVTCDRNGTVRGIKLDKTSKETDCEICIRGKMTRTPFPKNSERNSKVLEIIHSDVMGPMRVESNGKARYIVTFIDDYSRWGEIRLLKRKDEVFQAFKDYKSMVENLHNKKIQFLQTDNGREYLSQEFDAFLKDNGIRRRLAVTHTPEQNGVSERRNRTLMDMTRCLLMQSQLPPSFWGEAINTANHIRNRCPSRSLEGKTAYEKWIGKIPDVSYFQEFGSEVFIVDRTPSRGKLEPRSKKGTFVGYSEESKAYRIWLPDERRINVARDVKFIKHSETPSRNEESTMSFDNSDENFTEICTIFPTTDYRGNEDAQDQGDEDVNQDVDEHVDTPRRGRGRPRIERTGLRGRPRKIFHEANIAEEIAYLAEIPLEQAIHGPSGDEWRQAINSEIRSIISNDTWIITERPKEQKVIGSRIVLRNKYDQDGALVRRKARLVARGFAQQPGVDFYETFAPVARLGSVRALMALAAEGGMTVHQFDVTTAYLHGILEEKVFMEIPKYTAEALETIAETEPRDSDIGRKAAKMLNELRRGDNVCQLKKALYGLRQAGRCWYEKIDKELENYGASKSSADPCVYFKGKGENLILICVYVDDILVASRNKKEIENFGRYLSDAFEITNLGVARRCLGMEFTQRRHEITMCQTSYVRDILERFGMMDSKAVSTPLDPGTKLMISKEEPSPEEKKLPYRELIGALMYLAVCTRPDISYAVSYLSQFNSCFRTEHWTAAKHVLRYLRGSENIGLCFRRTENPLEGFVDADWANCPNDRRSYTGFVFSFAGCPISWEARKQRTVALSSTEAEYMALSEATKEATYLRRLLEELGSLRLGKIKISCDNNGARKLAENPVFHNRTKHIDVRHHYVREVLETGEIDVVYTPTTEMAADVLTKGLGKQKHVKCLNLLGMRRIGDTVSYRP